MTDDDPWRRIVADDGSSARKTADGVANMICFQPLWYCVLLYPDRMEGLEHFMPTNIILYKIKTTASSMMVRLASERENKKHASSPPPASSAIPREVRYRQMEEIEDSSPSLWSNYNLLFN